MFSGNLIAFYIPGELAFNERLLWKKNKLKAMFLLIWELYLSGNLFSISSLQQFRSVCRNL